MASRKLLTPEEVAHHASATPHWQVVEGKKLKRTYSFPDFASGLHLVNRVGEIAERQGHHPDIHLYWGKVEIEISTHDAGGLTELDFLLANEINRVS